MGGYSTTGGLTNGMEGVASEAEGRGVKKEGVASEAEVKGVKKDKKKKKKPKPKELLQHREKAQPEKIKSSVKNYIQLHTYTHIIMHTCGNHR